MEEKVAIVLLLRLEEEQTGIYESPECNADRKKVTPRDYASQPKN